MLLDEVPVLTLNWLVRTDASVQRIVDFKLGPIILELLHLLCILIGALAIIPMRVHLKIDHHL